MESASRRYEFTYVCNPGVRTRAEMELTGRRSTRGAAATEMSPPGHRMAEGGPCFCAENAHPNRFETPGNVPGAWHSGLRSTTVRRMMALFVAVLMVGGASVQLNRADLANAGWACFQPPPEFNPHITAPRRASSKQSSRARPAARCSSVSYFRPGSRERGAAGY